MDVKTPSNFENLVMQELKNITESQALLLNYINGLEKKVDLHIQKMEYEIKQLQNLDEIQNAELAKHIEGVETNKARLELQRIEFHKRMTKLEEPKKFASMAKEHITTTGALIGFFFLVVKFLEYIQWLK